MGTLIERSIQLTRQNSPVSHVNGSVTEFDVADGLPGSDAVSAYHRDGVVCLRTAYDAGWLSLIEEGIDLALSGRSEDLDIVRKPGDSGQFSFSSQAWRQVEPFRQFIFESRAPDLAWPFLDSTVLTLFYDFLLIKEAGAVSAKTPWHQDQAYYPLNGTQVINCWTALDPIPVQTALQFWKGSHAERRVYQAVDFAGESDYRHLQSHRPPPPDIDRQPAADILTTELAPGDMLVWNSCTFHSAPGNTLDRRRAAFSINWVGDGVTFHDIPSLQTYRADGLTEGMHINCDKFPVVRKRESS